MNKITRWCTNWGLAFTFAFVLLKLLGFILLPWVWVAAPLLSAFFIIFFVTPMLPSRERVYFRGTTKKDEEPK